MAKLMASLESATRARAPVASRAMRPLFSQPMTVDWSPETARAPPPCRMSLLLRSSAPAPSVSVPPLT